MAVTIGDIAARVGVTKATVSAVINNRKSNIRVSEKMRKRILDVVRELNYQPSYAARALTAGRTYTLGYICGDIASPHFSELAAQALHEAESRGYRLMVSATEWDHKKELACLDMLLQKRVDGVMIWSEALRPGVPQYEHICREKFPVVVFDQRQAAPMPGIVRNWQRGMSQAIQHLKGRGCQTVEYLGQAGDRDAKVIAFHQACKEAGVKGKAYPWGRELSDGRRAGWAIAERNDRPDAIIALNDCLAMGIIRGFNDRGVQVPQDIAVVGIDDTEMGQFFVPSLTTIRQDRHRIVSAAIDLLVKMIEAKELISKQVVLETELVVRESA